MVRLHINSWLLLALVILLCWLPYMILFYPGCANPDVQDQLGQFFHNETMCWTRKYVNLANPQHSYWNNHHPVFHTLGLGNLCSIWKTDWTYICWNFSVNTDSDDSYGWNFCLYFALFKEDEF